MNLRYLRSFALLLCCLLTFSATRAQRGPSILRLSLGDQGRGLNGVQKNFYFAPQGTNDYQNAGFFGQRLRPYLADNPQALDHLNSYRQQKWLFLAERLTFVSALGFYGQQVLAGEGEQRYFSNPQKVAIGVAAASLLANVFISRNTNTHFQRAVEANNAGWPAARGGVFQRLSPAAVGFTAAPTGQPLLALRWNLR
ncbi:hypothetical protein SAMN00120144_0548 [Hymenobacter roseosalivarius DSM 11622]|uniref:DUF5683 domain-containing protein n=1 Tax=Hymenobacter roseosalivarius DSM 11622 TaxID=645990 RepID=A0A1W1VRZ4_9BACT|nr:hypothetical protein [Hymenobacter roseosalivarius]SMB96145.1 hypothetical protein SAMN00120144_0548 [Hymenobacter roseosalivarius DSM 11622]